MSDTTPILTRISRRVAGRDPLLFLLAYLGLLPLFAGLYLLFASDGFYAPYARREPFAQLDKSRMIADVTAAALRNVTQKGGEASEGTACRFAGEGVYVATRDETVVGRVPLVAALPCVADSTRTMASANVLVDVSPIKIWIGGRPFYFHRVEHLLPPALMEEWRRFESRMVALLFESDVKGSDVQDRDLALRGLHILLTGEEEERFGGYAHRVSVDPATVRASFWRMLYLSAVVETTLGLGDIVPITGAARALVALEAIIGVILAGLFLNAAAYRASGR